MGRGETRTEDDLVRRPLKRAEFGVVLITRQAETGWADGLVTYRNAIIGHARMGRVAGSARSAGTSSHSSADHDAGP